MKEKESIYFNIHTIKQHGSLTCVVIARHDRTNYKIEIDNVPHKVLIEKDSGTDWIIINDSLKHEIFKSFKADPNHKYLLEGFDYQDIK